MKLTLEQKEANKVARKLARETAKETARIEAEKNQRPIREITISIGWKKSYMWGNNPHCDAKVRFKEAQGLYGGTYEDSPTFTCSGCGYDKESTVIADVFNHYLKYKLWGKSIEECRRCDYKWKEEGGAPYGVSAGKYSYNGIEREDRRFSGGIGTDCYYRIAEFIGGRFEHVASGKTFDVYKYTDLED